MGRQPCERRKRLLATEVASEYGWGQGRGGETEPQKPIWRRGDGFQAALEPTEGSSRSCNGHREVGRICASSRVYMPNFIKKSMNYFY